MKQMARSRRAMLGAACLVAVALVMGWFVGRYIPGEPRQPEQAPMTGLTNGNGSAVSSVVDLPAGSTMKLRDVTQGYAFDPHYNDGSQPQGLIEELRKSAYWEYDCPDVDVSVEQIRTISTRSFAEWYPEYRTMSDWTYNDSTLVVVTASFANASDKRIDRWYLLPAFTLWSGNLARIDNTLGAGACLDGAFYLINDPPDGYTYPEYGPEGPQSGAVNPDDPDPSVGRYLDLEPGESQTLMLAFRINKNNLVNDSAFDDLDPADFCLQVADCNPATAYRLWL